MQRDKRPSVWRSCQDPWRETATTVDNLLLPNEGCDIVTIGSAHPCYRQRLVIFQYNLFIVLPKKLWTLLSSSPPQNCSLPSILLGSLEIVIAAARHQRNKLTKKCSRASTFFARSPCHPKISNAAARKKETAAIVAIVVVFVVGCSSVIISVVVTVAIASAKTDKRQK